MISRRRLRSMFAPALGLRTAAVVTLLGLAVFLAGVVLSFRLAIAPLLQGAADHWRAFLQMFVGRENVDTASHLVGGAFLLGGAYLLAQGLRQLVGKFVETLNPEMGGKVVGEYVRRQQLAQGPRIVAIGGGTGLSTLLRGLKQRSINITAIVTVTDDGGSSGRLVQEMGIIPPGDIRNCLVALADAEKRMTDLFQHRFHKDSGALSGHSLGNILLAGLVDQAGGDFERALQIASEVLNIRGRVVPSTLDHVRLRAVMEDGAEVWGETKITQSGSRIRRLYLDPAGCAAHPDAIEAIRAAELVCIGPGSIFTSVIPNLLVPGIAQALSETHALRVYVCNVMTQPGESDSFGATEHVLALEANVGQRVCDYVVVNTAMPSPAAVEKYREEGQYVVEADIDRIRAMGYRVLAGNFMSETDYVRHDPLRVVHRLMGLLNR
jgi:uncharacterized cofD-like protein